MSDPPRTDLTAYAQTICTALGIDELEPIDFAQCERLTDDIERRRALFRYFIPEVFTPGKFDRRADLIDACIYYLEALEGKGQFWGSPVIDAWTQRAHFTRSYRFEDVELGPYGYEFYHPLWSNLGTTANPGLVIPALVKYIRMFKDRKLKLGINEYSLIFFSIYNATPPAPIDDRMMRVAEIVQEVIQQPLLNGFELWSIIQPRYPCAQSSAKKHAAQFTQLGFRVIISFERSVFGLARYILQFRFPHHYEINIHGVPPTQNFLTGGREYLQEVGVNLPLEELDWRRVIAQVHPESQLYRMTMCRRQIPNASPLTYFNVKTQDWTIPWDSCVRECEARLEAPRDSTPYDPDWGFLMPDEDLVKLSALLEGDPLILNSDLQTRMRQQMRLELPLERVKELRATLEQEAAVERILWIPYFNTCLYCIIDVPGVEKWKYRILTQLSRFIPFSYLNILENVRTGVKSLRAGYAHRPSHIKTFARLFHKTFRGKFDFSLRFMFHRPNLPIPFYERFDLATGNWRNDLPDYSIRPMPFAKLQRGRCV